MRNAWKLMGLCFFCILLFRSNSLFAQGTPNYVFDYENSSAILTHIGDLANSDTAYTLPGATTGQLETYIPNEENYVPIPNDSFGFPSSSPSSFQLNNDVFSYTDSDVGTSTSTANAAVYSVTTKKNMFVGLKAGTGIAQNNGGQFYSGASALDVHVDARWMLNAPFPISPAFPGISYQLPVAGITGIGGNDRFLVNLSFYDLSVSPTTPIGNISIDSLQLFNNTNGATPLSFSQLFSGTALLNNGAPVPAGDELQMVGDIIFKAKNDESPSSFSLTDDSEFGIFNSDTDPSGAPVPAPAAMGLAGFGLLALGRLAVRRRGITA